MIAWLMRRRCGNCRVSLFGLCYTHHRRWTPRIDAAKRWALFVLSMVAFVALWAIAGRRWAP